MRVQTVICLQFASLNTFIFNCQQRIEERDNRIGSQKQLLFSCLMNITDSPFKRVGLNTPLHMFVVRVLLGHPYVARKPYKFCRPPCLVAGCTGLDRCSNKTHPGIHDSIIGTHRPDGTRLLFREFIVYHPDQSYPEYLVEYVRK
jgi:hypothetical protein